MTTPRFRLVRASTALGESPDRLQVPKDGIALCLSGGGYRAMIFHLGAMWRLNELGLLNKLSLIASVSGGSIAAGVLGMNWRKLEFDNQNRATNLTEKLVDPVLGFASHTIDLLYVARGILVPSRSVATEIAREYSRHLFGLTTLQELPAPDEGPRFIINASNLQSGAVWHFSRESMGDWLVGTIANPRTLLGEAVAAQDNGSFIPFILTCSA